MSRFYFHHADGRTDFDEEGTELADLNAVRAAAVKHAGEILRDGRLSDGFWSGLPSWRLWVTDQPSGAGNTILTLSVTT
jgi:hypothetical protein